MWWRADEPAKQVGGRVSKIKMAEILGTISPNTDTGLPWEMLVFTPQGRIEVVNSEKRWAALCEARTALTTVQARFPEHEGRAVFTRPPSVWSMLGLAMRQQGIPTYAETDDNYFTPAHNTLALRDQKSGEMERVSHAKAMVALEHNIFSTEWLRDRYHREYRKRFGKQKLPQLHVCRNHVPREMWPTPVPRTGKLRVGFMGSLSHVWDVNLIFQAFDTAKALGCETYMVGYNPAAVHGDAPDTLVDEETGEEHRVISEESRAAEAQWKQVVDVGIPWIEPEEYHRVAIPFDIGLAPLLHNDFTDAKSDIKMIEYAISGAVGVCANTAPYNRAGWKHEVNCLMANSPQEYALATMRLIKDEPLRRELLAAAQEMIRSERNELVMQREWRGALEL